MVDAIVRSLCDRIATRVLAPGNRITEQNICSEFAVARSTAREVLTALQQRGLVDRPPNHSAVVVGLSADEYYAILNIREVLDGLCVRLATENSLPETWQDLVDLFGAPMDKVTEEGNIELYLQNLAVFYRRTREASKNKMLCQMLESIDDRSRYVTRRIILLPGRIEHGLKQFREMIAAMRRGEAELAERLRRENIRSQKQYFTRYIDLVLDRWQ